jgi:hypothetical protein
MLTVLYISVFLVFTFASSVVAFLAGRCARRFPLLDNHLPWTMHRGQPSASTSDTWTKCESKPDQPRGRVQQ